MFWMYFFLIIALVFSLVIACYLYDRAHEYFVLFLLNITTQLNVFLTSELLCCASNIASMCMGPGLTEK